jgi:hypothetical protein
MEHMRLWHYISLLPAWVKKTQRVALPDGAKMAKYHGAKVKHGLGDLGVCRP